jgi:hypothetical protein
VPVERLDRYAGFLGDPVHRAFRIAILKERPQRMTPATFGSMLRVICRFKVFRSGKWHFRMLRSIWALTRPGTSRACLLISKG